MKPSNQFTREWDGESTNSWTSTMEAKLFDQKPACYPYLVQQLPFREGHMLHKADMYRIISEWEEDQ